MASLKYNDLEATLQFQHSKHQNICSVFPEIRVHLLKTICCKQLHTGTIFFLQQADRSMYCIYNGQLSELANVCIPLDHKPLIHEMMHVSVCVLLIHSNFSEIVTGACFPVKTFP